MCSYIALFSSEEPGLLYSEGPGLLLSEGLGLLYSGGPGLLLSEGCAMTPGLLLSRGCAVTPADKRLFFIRRVCYYTSAVISRSYAVHSLKIGLYFTGVATEAIANVNLVLVSTGINLIP